MLMLREPGKTRATMELLGQVEIKDPQSRGAFSAASTTYRDTLFTLTTTFAQEDGYHDIDASMTEDFVQVNLHVNPYDVVQSTGMISALSLKVCSAIQYF
jgi:hypothetical protein